MVAPSSEVDFALARRAVERGWVTQEQVESALVSYDRTRGTRLLAHLPLTPEQIRELEGPGRPIPPEAAEAMKDPSNRVGRCFWRVNHLKSGGMGAVWRGWDAELHRWVALKFLKELGDETARAYFRREAQLAAGLDHPHIAKVYEVGEHERSPFIAMQFIDGVTLGEAKLGLEGRLAAVGKVAEAVRHAHAKGIIHRDLKPGNVMVDREGAVYVMDFGLAKQTNVDVSGTAVLGTPSYMAPEQARGRATEQSDVYGIGAILYELLTGRPPFTGESSGEVLEQVLVRDLVSPRRLNPGVPEDVEAIVVKALEKDSWRRYADAGQMLEDLEAFRQKNPLRHAKRVTWGYVLRKRIRKQPWLWGLGAALVVAVLAGASFGAYTLVQRNRALRDKLRIEAEARRAIEEERRKTTQALAGTQSVRARQAAEAGDFPAALALYAESNRLAPTETARLNAQFFLSRVARLSEVRELGAPIFALAGDSPVALTPKAWPMEEGEAPLALAPDGRHFATALRAQAVMRIRRVADGSLVGSAEILDQLAPVAFSSDGSTLFTLTRDRAIGSWRVEDASFLRRLAPLGPRALVTAMCLSEDGTRLFLWVDGSMWEVGVQTGWAQQVYATEDPPLIVHRMSAMPGGRYLAIAVGKAVAFLDLKELRRVYRDVAHRDYVDTWDVSPDGSIWATGSRDGFVRFWTFPECEPTGQVLRVKEGVFALRFSPDGKKLYTGGSAGLLETWDLTTDFARELTNMPAVKSVQWVPGGRRFLARDPQKRMRLHDAENGAPLGDALDLGEDFPWEVFSEDRKYVAVVAKSIQVMDLESGRRVGEPFPMEASGVEGFFPDGRVLVTGKEGRACVWDPRRGHVEDLPVGEYKFLSGHVLEAVGDRVRVDGGPEIALRVKRIWRGETGRRALFDLGDGRAQVYRIPELVPEGPELRPGTEAKFFLFRDRDTKVVGHNDRGAVFVWDAAGNRKLVPPPLQKDDQLWSGPILSPHALRAVLRSGRLWNLETGQEYGETIPWKDLYPPARFTPDGAGFLVLTQNSAQLFDVSTGRPRWGTISLPAYPDSVEFLGDGRWLVVGCRGEGVHLYEASTGQRVGAPLEHLERGLGLNTEAIFDETTLRLLSYHTSMPAKASSIRIWDLGFLFEESEPEELLRSARRSTGVGVNDRGEVEPVPIP